MTLNSHSTRPYFWVRLTLCLFEDVSTHQDYKFFKNWTAEPNIAFIFIHTLTHGFWGSITCLAKIQSVKNDILFCKGSYNNVLSYRDITNTMSYCGSPKKKMSNLVWGRQKTSIEKMPVDLSLNRSLSHKERDRPEVEGMMERHREKTSSELDNCWHYTLHLYNLYLLQTISLWLRKKWGSERVSDFRPIFTKVTNGVLKSALSFPPKHLYCWCRVHEEMKRGKKETRDGHCDWRWSSWVSQAKGFNFLL